MEPASVPLIVDHDGGLDDYAAIATLSIRSSRAQLLLVTTVKGACRRSEFSSHLSKQLLAALGHDKVPVVAGSDAPDAGDQKLPSWLPGHQVKLRAALAWWGVRPWEEYKDVFVPIDPANAEQAAKALVETYEAKLVPSPSASAEQAAKALVETAETHFHTHGQKVTVLALGPLTNVAYAVEYLGERARESIERIVVAADLGTKVTSDGYRAAPFNVRMDPSSFDKVLKSGLRVMLCRPQIPPGEMPLASLALGEVREQSFAAHALSRYATPAEDAKAPFTGKEIQHLLQDPVVAFFIIDPKAFHVSATIADEDGSFQRVEFAQAGEEGSVEHIGFNQYSAWLQEAVKEHALGHTGEAQSCSLL